MVLPLEFLSSKESKEEMEWEFLPPVFFMMFLVFTVWNDWIYTQELIGIHLATRISFSGIGEFQNGLDGKQS